MGILLNTTFASGVNLAAAHWHLKNAVVNNDLACVHLQVWKNKAEYDAGKPSALPQVFSQIIHSSDPVWATYFSDAAMDASGKNVKGLSLDYILTLDGTQQGDLKGLDFTSGVID